MPPFTYRARTEFISPALSAPEYLLEANAVLINDTMDRIVTLRRVWWDIPVHQAIPQVAPASAPLGTIEYRRVSSVSGGELLTAAEHDTTNALPSQVSVRVRPSSATLGDLVGLRSEKHRASQGASSTNHPNALTLGQTMPVQQDARWNKSAPTQPYILREGEGLGIVQTLSAMAQIVWGEVVLRELSSGETYRYVSTLFNAEVLGHPQVVVFNGSGSGVVIEVVAINTFIPFALASSQASEDGMGGVGLSYVSKKRWVGGEDLPIVSYDTGNPAPTGIVLKRQPSNSAVLDHLVSAMATWTRTFTNVTNTTFPGLRHQANYRVISGATSIGWPIFSAGTMGRCGAPGVPVFGARYGEGITLRPGESIAMLYCLAVIQTAPLNWNNFDVCFEFTVENIPGDGSDTSIRTKPAFKLGAVI